MFPVSGPSVWCASKSVRDARLSLVLGSALVIVLALAACSSSTVTPSAAASVPQQQDTATACAPNVGAGATAYPGWPGGGQAIAPNADTIPYITSRDLAVGPNRFLVTVIDSKNANVASASLPIDLAFFNLAGNPAQPIASAPATYFDNGAGLGLYRASATFPCWGDWGVEVKMSKPTGVSTARVVFDVQAASSTPQIGTKAPAADTPTASDAAGIAAISTDTKPDPDFYRMTITQAETSGKPSLIIFATPAFCQTATCGPTLSVVKAAAQAYKGKVNFVHVEPYRLQKTDAGLQPILGGQDGKSLQTIPATDTFGLLSEPFTLVLDAQGRVTAKFDGIMGADEVTAALAAVAGGSAPSPAASAAAAGSASPAGNASPAGSASPPRSALPSGSGAPGATASYP